MKHFLDRVEFYITNVCNYNCEHCNRFNNYHFTGQQKWEEYFNVYEQWSKKLDINYISILGGEPLLNPGINKWIDGITTNWPTARVEIVTNGTRLNKVKKLYETIKKTNGRAFIHIGLHNKDHLSKVTEEVFEFLNSTAESTTVVPDSINALWKADYDKLSMSGWPECNTPDDFDSLPKEIQDVCRHNSFDNKSFLEFNSYIKIADNNVQVEIHIENIFHRSALRRNGNEFIVHDSDPIKAHEICYEKHNHHFIKGKLYKCNVTGVLPEFYKQFHVVLSDEDKALMHGYKPLTVTDSDATMEVFIDALKNEVPQCKFCPEFLHAFNLQPSTQKIKIEKKKT
jgi:organic radical activating enzyme